MVKICIKTERVRLFQAMHIVIRTMLECYLCSAISGTTAIALLSNLQLLINYSNQHNAGGLAWEQGFNEPHPQTL